jgi:hypothetical protein
VEHDDSLVGFDLCPLLGHPLILDKGQVKPNAYPIDQQDQARKKRSQHLMKPETLTITGARAANFSLAHSGPGEHLVGLDACTLACSSCPRLNRRWLTSTGGAQAHTPGASNQVRWLAAEAHFISSAGQSNHTGLAIPGGDTAASSRAVPELSLGNGKKCWVYQWSQCN